VKSQITHGLWTATVTISEGAEERGQPRDARRLMTDLLRSLIDIMSKAKGQRE